MGIFDELIENIEKSKKLNDEDLKQDLGEKDVEVKLSISEEKLPKKRGRKPKSESHLNLTSMVIDSNKSFSPPPTAPFSIIPEDDSEISNEIRRFSAQLNEQFLVLESIKPIDIDDIEARLKASKLKIELMQKLPTLMAQLDELKNKEKVKKEQVRGSRDLSPVDDGSLNNFTEDDFKDLDNEYID